MTDNEMAQWRELPLETWPAEVLRAEVERLREYVTALKSENTNLQELYDTLLFASADTAKRLQAENATLREIAHAVAASDAGTNDDGYCVLGGDCCPEWIGPDYPVGHWQHAPDCPVTKARALLAP
jgi:hypothetical protein